MWRMVPLRIESRREFEHMRGAKLHAEPACFASLHDNCNAPLSSQWNPPTGIDHSFPCLELSVGLLQEGVTLITNGCEVLHTPIPPKSGWSDVVLHCGVFARSDLPSATRNIALFPRACGEKKLATSSS